ncbi:hypothetical protein [Sphingosinicella sp. CPCC 101087]|uniref:hypothetical protein n=1 Tax=Sphingosinicella sp. CPCC 101087 TaxID=2497754 RepID=UPI00101D5EB4|nr:hypothetical protein [Sphingosinicella sp. CPCC 101087]
MNPLRRLAILFLLLVAAPAAAQPALPALDVELAPVVTGGAVTRVDVQMRIEAPALAAGGALLRLPLTIVSIPTSAYEASAISARDDAGPLALTQEEEAPRPEGVYRRFLVSRATRGDVVVEYSAAPRQVSETTNNGPLFDMRAENGGFTSAGISFLALPVREAPFRVSLKWNLSRMAPGSIGVWSLGEGDVETVAPAQQLAFTFYAAGPMRRYRPEGGGRLTLYALSEAPFDLQALANRIGGLYEHMAGFFGEGADAYRVFARQHPYRGRGGTALPRSFTFGYHAPSNPTIDELQGMLSHEIAHGWPSMQGEHGETAWYSEGTAEYYSILLARRAGLLDDGRFLEEINERAGGYYAHSFRSLSNAEAAQRFWSDPFVQQVPYGRGFLYLARTDGAIRTASDGRRSLDDVVLALRERQAAGQSYGIADWLDLVGREIGRDRAEQDYRSMAAGEVVRPGSAFADCFLAVPAPARRLELGFARRSFNDGAVVQGLIEGSYAERAGVRDGDAILDYTDLDEISADAAKEMRLTIRRDGREQVISYLPRAQEVEAWRWVPNPQAAEKACNF